MNGQWSFRVYWYFNTTVTIRQRFANAVSSGESVSYVVVQSSGTSSMSGGFDWRRWPV